MSQTQRAPAQALGTGERAPIVHLALLGIGLLLMLIGGQARFGDWGTGSVRLLAGYLLAATVVHAASRYAQGASLVLRGLGWLIMVAGLVHSGVLARPEVLIPVAALAGLDLWLHGSKVTTDLPDPSTVARIVAGVVSLAALIVVALLVLYAQSTEIMARLGATVLVAWGLILLFALAPQHRGTRELLGGALAFSVTFLFLAAPVMPFGPLLAYWVAILSVATAVVVGALTSTQPAFTEEVSLHAQRVQTLPDPVTAATREEVRQYLSTGTGAAEISKRIEQAMGREPNGRLLPALAEARARGAKPSRTDRRLALAELLDLDDLPDPPEAPS